MTNRIRQSIDVCLNSLTCTQDDRMQVLAAIQEDTPLLKKKANVSFALVILSVLLVTVALAVGLTYSAKYQATRSAHQALTEKYQLSQEMLKLFDARETRETDGETSIVFYSSGGSQFVNAEAMGRYTVVIDAKGNTAASWSHDHVDAAVWLDGDLDSSVWGAPQLNALLDRYALYQQWQRENGNIHGLSMAEQEKRYEELYALIAPLQIVDRPIDTTTDLPIMEEEIPLSIAPTAMPGDLPASQLVMLARRALAEAYGLTEQALADYTVSVWYQYDENGNCCVDFNGYETSCYVVLRATDGEVQEAWMDSALGSNG